MTTRLTFLGTGTSTGIPLLRCRCDVCRSHDPRDQRLRCSALVRYGHRTLLVDPGPDLRYQLLRAGSPDIDAVLVTHSHYDHVGGIDDLRPYCTHRRPVMPVYCTEDVAKDLRERVPYCFAEKHYPGAPRFDLRVIQPGEAFFITDGSPILPVRVMHGPKAITGYRFGSLAYVTDCKEMPPETRSLLECLDVLVLNALRPEPHFSHLSLSEALDLIAELRPRRAYLTHAGHQMPPHAAMRHYLPPNVRMAYDGLTITASPTECV